MDSPLDPLLSHPGLAPLVAHRRRLEASPPVFGIPRIPLDPRLADALAARGIERLWAHQAAALDLVREGSDVLMATPTASGKTLLFALAVLETVLAEPRAKALFLYPTKALAQDQLAGFRALSGALGPLRPPRFEIYDGDTPEAVRRRIRSDPPQALITNPDMLHAGILAHHGDWAPFLRELRWIVLDELHVYRGLFGSHVHHVLKRLERLCADVGARPRVIAASATVGNPQEFAATLLGRRPAVVAESGAPLGPREVVFLNPVALSPYTAAVRVIAATLGAGLRTIAFTKARRTTELLHTWLLQQEPRLRDAIAPYRAGYLAAERREIEARLFRGELRGVLATSALELGIDVGALDACVLVGYPGSLISTWQRIGRVGRRQRTALVVLVAMPDALDQYVVHHPELFFGGRFERAVLDPWNPLVAGQHLVCAAAERPLEADELERWGPASRERVAELARTGRLAEDAVGRRWFSFRRKPHRDVSPRAAGAPFTIVEARGRRVLGQIDAGRVWRECHPGAVYLHAGASYHVLELDAERRQVRAEPLRADYYTVVLGDKETEILEQLAARRLGPFAVGLGRLKVTVRVREYQKKRLFDGEPLSTHALDAPPQVFETVGFWIEMPPELPAAFSARGLHFMGGIHAAEHAMIGLFPLLAIADRDDVGGISYTGHPQLGAPAVFVYDGVPGGAGLAAQGFHDLEPLIARTLELIAGCPCEAGCPACIQSPKCGNGNKPLDKAAAQRILELWLGRAEPPERAADPVPPPPPSPPPVRRHGIIRAGNVDPPRPTARPSERLVFFDLETQRGAAEVGGWSHTAKMGLALAVVYDDGAGGYRTYFEADVDGLLLDLALADRVVGFNIERFDLAVLSAYTDRDLSRLRTLDLLGEIHRRFRFRLSLGHLAEVNLGEAKSADGLQSLDWWKQGRVDLIERYCRRDVDVTRRLYTLGRERGYLLYRGPEERAVRLPVDW